MIGAHFSKCLFLPTAALLSTVLLAQTAVEQPGPLSESHRKWLEEEVVYIITDREKDVFGMLESVEEREHFIQAFWKKRDPVPETPENEFKDEHYRRIEYANEHFGRQTSRAGWQTDQGRIYITLGEPRQRERFEAHYNIAYCELWTYQAPSGSGLPPFFHLLFWKRHDVGEYRLYSPMGDGPLRLMRGIDHYTNDPTIALRELLDISPDLAHASLTFDMSEAADFQTGRPSMGSEIIVARIAEVPKRAVRTDYADAWLRYGNRVSAEYSFNFVPSRSVFAVLGGPNHTPFVHYRVEMDPENFSLVGTEDESKYFTTLDVSLEVAELDGRAVLARDKEIYIELSPAEIREFNQSPFAYQDDFPLLPGEYTVTIILRNRAAAEYTVAETNLAVVAMSPDEPGLSDVILAYEVQNVEDDAAEQELRTFQIGRRRFHPAADGVFFVGETASAFVQVDGATPDYKVKMVLSHGEEILEERTVPVDQKFPKPVEESFSLLNMLGGQYSLGVQLVDPEGRTVVEKATPLNVSPRSAMPRPWVHSRSFDTRLPGVVSLAKGEQLQARQRYEDAARELGAAVLANPELAEARWRLAGIHLGWRQPDQALALLLPIEEAYSEQYEVVAGLGFAFYMKDDIASALPYLERASTIRPPGTSLLNALGDCHQRSGNTSRAKELFQRSLDIDPDQKPIRERIGILGEGS